MNKRILAAMMAATMMLSMTACGGSKEETAPAGENTEAAAEGTAELGGKVMIYTSMYEDVIDVIDAELEEAFPNIDVEFFYGGTGQIQSKVAAEMESGKLGCDMLMVAEPAYSLELKEKGVLHAYVSPEAGSLRFDYDAEGYWYPVRVSNMVLAYNPEKVSKDAIPNSFEDFAKNAAVQGKISMGNPLTSGTSMASIVGLLDLYGEEYFEALGNQNVAVESGSVALTKLETGECDVIMILEESVLKKREEEGSMLEVIYPTDGTLCIPSTIVTVNDEWNANQNTAACQAITDWFLSEEGQNHIVSAWMHSTRTDFARNPYDAIPTTEIMANAIAIDWNKCYQERDAIRTMFQEHVTIPESK